MQVLEASIAAPYAILAGAVVSGALPYLSFLAATALSVIPGRTFLAFARDTHLDAERVAPLKRYAIKWHSALGVGLALGLSLSGGL